MEEKTDRKSEIQWKNAEIRKPQSNSESTKDSRKVAPDKTKSVDRVLLKPAAYSRTEEWLSQVGKHHKGVRVTRNDLVNIILVQHAAKLSEGELSLIGQAHYDEVRFYTWAVKIVREARSRGESLTIASLEKQYKGSPAHGA